ncbi:hypothetical protein AB0C44_00820 [Micromonospora taraxaci]|uniref:hypothetical protein n=1 Tax=Micromonospora taraxaci TaxID=1316803 RepID=UPI0033EF14BF
MLPANLQPSVERFARSLQVPSRLIQLHPRKQGNPGNYAALAPAVTLGVISAFEGFAEDFLATALYARGSSLGQIAAKVSMNNPTVAVFRDKLIGEFNGISSKIGVGFTVDVWDPPPVGKSWWRQVQIPWADAVSQADGWMQVRHCLTHGLASGWRTEHWPGPLKGKATASSVLRRMPSGTHSLALHGAITCARIYVTCAAHLANLAASEVAEKLDWSQVPEFPLLDVKPAS